MNKQEINKNSLRASLDLITVYTPLVVDCFYLQDKITVVKILEHHGFVKGEVAAHVLDFYAVRVVAYITISGKKQYTYVDFVGEIGLNFAIHVTPSWLLKSNPLPIDTPKPAEPTDRVQEIGHESIDFYEITQTSCTWSAVIQATANKLINNGYTDIGEGDCEHTILHVNHKEKTFYTK